MGALGRHGDPMREGAAVRLTQAEAEALYEFFERDGVPPHWEETAPIQRVQQKCREAFRQGYPPTTGER